MAIPVFFTAELLPFGDLRGSAIDDATTALGAELKEFFADKGDFVMGSGSDAVVGMTLDQSVENPDVRVAIASLVGGFRGMDDADAVLALAKSFTSEQFKNVTVSLDESSIANHPTGEPADKAGAS
ncbi:MULTISPECIES: hypothetical protein [Mycolicibacter]|uniref:Uncharacterized protein n=2 Tax=Mycolicibacter TaxID=1073531 RepID=A0ABU5XKW0_9MYCO|nr:MULTISPECIES: hypothetical protein [unclassified Mycolicibacter]MEB3022925.1 hypothetical protein [Mycolicibacter sp. MYC098]MEB3034980.1 hypothetical protein [Mycolicibacter sp. MYC340]